MSSSSNKIILKSSDGESFEVDEAVALQSHTIKHMIEDGCSNNGIPIPNVTGEVLSNVIVYCKKHADMDQDEDDLKDWDRDFVMKSLDRDALFDLILAANYLNIKDLLELTCKKVADMMKGKMPAEIREIFNIENDFTPEEEAEIRRENEWAFNQE